jgi:hypothetical protein
MKIRTSDIRRALAELTHAAKHLTMAGPLVGAAEASLAHVELISAIREAEVILAGLRAEAQEESARILARTPIPELRALLDAKIDQAREDNRAQHELNDHHLGGKAGR